MICRGQLIIFKGIRDLMLIDRICKKAGLEVRVMPIPHEYSSECGMTLVVSQELIEQVKFIISQNGIDVIIIQ